LSFEPKARADNWGISGTIDYALGESFSLKSITAYRELNGSFTVDGDASPFGLYTGALGIDTQQFSQELRLNGTVADILDFTIGGFYFTSDVITLNRARGYSTFDQIQADTVENESKAAFAHLELELTPDLSVLGGLRYTDDEKIYTFNRREGGAVPYGLFGLFGTTAAIDGASGTFSGDRIDWRVGLNYQVNPDVMVYAQAASGYKAGGINPRPFYAEQVVPFAPETLVSYEVGVKSLLADGRIRLNVAGFYSDYSNVLVTVSSCPNLIPPGGAPLCNLVTNGGAARIKGLEVETFLEPIDNLTIDGSLGYIDFEYTTDLSAVGIGPVAPYTPEVTAAVGIQYEAELGGNAGTVTPRLDWVYRSATFMNASNSPLSRQEAYSVFNGRIGWRSSDDDNIFDKEYYLQIQEAFARTFGVASGVPSRPREFAISVTRNF
jgi:iron complex outermembrane recepter protein